MRSLQSRLTLGLVLSLLLLLAGQWAVVDRMVRAAVEGYAQSRIDHDMESLLAAVEFDADGAPRLASPALNAVYNQPLSGHYYQLRAGGRLLRSRSLWDERLPDAPLPPGTSARFHHHGPGEQHLVGSSRGFDIRGHRLTITVAEDLSPLRAELERYRLYFAALFVVLLTLLILIQRLVVRRGLAPLERARRDIGRLERGEIEQLDEQAPLEVRPLVVEINRLLGVMNRRLRRSRDALGNLSHALKAPLTLLTQSTEGAPSPLREELRGHADAIGRLMERELKRARLAGGGGGPRLDPRRELEPLLESLRRIHPEKPLQFELRMDDALALPMDREDLLELLGNLLDNACKWSEGRIRIRADGTDGITLTIEDDGPGVPPEQIDALTRRGSRLDESTTGHGLGLAIVQALVEDYGGRLELDRSPELGGLRTTVHLREPFSTE